MITFLKFPMCSRFIGSFLCGLSLLISPIFIKSAGRVDQLIDSSASISILQSALTLETCLLLNNLAELLCSFLVNWRFGNSFHFYVQSLQCAICSCLLSYNSMVLME